MRSFQIDYSKAEPIFAPNNEAGINFTEAVLIAATNGMNGWSLLRQRWTMHSSMDRAQRIAIIADPIGKHHYIFVCDPNGSNMNVATCNRAYALELCGRIDAGTFLMEEAN